MQLHTCAAELLYKHNITLVDVRYGCILACCDYLWHLVRGLMPMAESQSYRYTKKVRGHCCGLLNINCCHSENIECHIVLFFCQWAHKNGMTLQMTVILQCRFFHWLFCACLERGQQNLFFLHALAYWGWQANNNLLKGYWSLLDTPDPSSSLPPSLFIMWLSLSRPLKRNHPAFIWSRPH